jgi:hypothetical protein
MSSVGLNRNRYIRLIAISATEILGTIPLGTLIIVKNAKLGVDPWKGWAWTHEDYSVVYQVPASIWKNTPDAFALEMYRWSLVLCAFLFFALFGFADEARRHYRSVYASIASRIGYSISALHKSSHACVVHSIYGSIATHGCFFFSASSVPHVKGNGGIAVNAVKRGVEKQDLSLSLSHQSSMPSISIANDHKIPDFRVEQFSPSNTMTAVTSSSVESFHESKTQDQSTMPSVVMMPTAPPATVPPHFPETTRSTLRAYSSYDAV